jgi:PAN domain/TIR domain/Sel1 repeat
MMAAKVFISYRRDDSAGHAGRVHDRLSQEFGRDLLFMDVDAVPLGADFIKILREEVAGCDVLLAVIGPNWLNVRDEEGNRRLDNANDFVRIEIATALQRDIPVIPILLDGAKIPKSNQLPKDLEGFTARNALYVHHTSFHSDMDKLIAGLRGQSGHIGALATPRTTPEEPGNTEEAAARQSAKGDRRWGAIVIGGLLAAAFIGTAVIWVEMTPRTPVSRPSPTPIQTAPAPTQPPTPPPAADCDRLAASPLDPTHPLGVVGVDPDKINTDQAVPACQAALSEHPNDPRIAFQLGRALERIGTPDSESEAMRLYQKGTDSGFAPAMARLGLMYAAGRGGLAQNDQEAARLYKLAADQGFAVAQYNLGEFYETGRGGLEKNDQEAARLYKLAADQGYRGAKAALTRFLALPATGPAAKMSEREDGKDRRGGDYLCFDVSTDHIEDCEAACRADMKCAAWTYIRPAAMEPNARCCMKSVIPAASDNTCCVSGTKIR